MVDCGGLVRGFGFSLYAALGFLCLAAFADGAYADQSTSQSLELAAALPLSGDGTSFGQPTLEGVQLAIEEANAGGGPLIDLKIYDDKSTVDGAKDAAKQVTASKAVIVLGPSYSTQTLAAAPIYAEAGMVVLPPTATSDAITDYPTTFRVVFKNSDQGELLATYAYRVLGQRKADVIVEDNTYGQTLRAGFERAAEKVGLDVQYFPFKTIEEAKASAREIANDMGQPAIVFLTLDSDGSQILKTLKANGAEGPVLGDDAFGGDTFSAFFADQPEERRQPGYFTEGVYGVTPMILDSANAETLAFAARYRARFGHDPVWMSVAGYDAARAAVAAARAAAAGEAYRDVAAVRRAAQTYLTSLSSPDRAIPGLLGPIWFDQTRSRQQAIRIGRFAHGQFESAPLQIVPVTTPDATEIASGAVFDIGPGNGQLQRYARLQRIVYTGVFINEIPRVDLSRTSFGADFYLWLRFAKDAGPNGADPTDINFPNMMGGGFDRTHPAEQGEMSDGTEYRLWRVQGEFRNDFDLHRFPFDRQALSISFFNSRAATDRIVYALDKRSPAGERNVPSAAAASSSGGAMAASPTPSRVSPALASPAAFRNLTQWAPIGVSDRRENLVTESGLGDPRRAGVESYRELSGFIVTVLIERLALATASKTLLPLFLMTMIMFASLFFPHALVKEKVTVAITAALSGAVLLTAINSQLGSVGYTIAVEYAFYVFFCLCLLCIVSVLGAERLRVAGRASTALVTDRWTRIAFLLAVAATLAGAFWLAANAAR